MGALVVFFALVVEAVAVVPAVEAAFFPVVVVDFGDVVLGVVDVVEGGFEYWGAVDVVEVAEFLGEFFGFLDAGVGFVDGLLAALDFVHGVPLFL
jgi:hypothetical protein